ncbi:serine O-acetyltransferase [Pseudomonas syringae]|uniref:serine O-acetyltransferase n=1 Tax=Pseudomonas syringae TaxID=317 RepID=UPI0018E5EA25|nr:serine O-acetyltransferase [Pseudomonas syringae]MBI6740823.1 serine acetyltransferase [Pseudomonas syringae]MBI6745728.1 serine acetyltransferase [Pseudomonas syringae]MBI6760482.1 serine acetyltransferase [Pseudomonas syringae]MBI6804920.1 serine acetyltransferase [Pseudomonas syringae]MBI6825018.1 serine acetyltransferase [Pseudomonas syringae]
MPNMDIRSVPSSRLAAAGGQESFQLVKNLVIAALLECCSVEEFNELKETLLIECFTEQSHEDLLMFARKDPASCGDPSVIARTYTSFAAVMHYRLAHWVYQNAKRSCNSHEQSLAAIISRRGKMLSGAEIHFRCSIGARLIIDHGFGTVIGETAILGDDCYILGGVTLGARGISSNPSISRHPKVGNRVQIGAFSSVLGPVNIGDDAFIGPRCIITQDVPSGARVQVKTSLQVVIEQ